MPGDILGQTPDLEGNTMRMTPMATAQMPATVMSALRVAPGSAGASTPSGTSSRPVISSSHHFARMRRAANAPEMGRVPMAISQAPSTMATATRPRDHDDPGCASTSSRRACWLPDLVIDPCRRRVPEECSEGTTPRKLISCSG
jgi:hypothetical protein